MPNEIPKELIEQWSREHMESLNLTDPLEYIAQRAVEWERERLAKLAGEPVAWMGTHPRSGAIELCEHTPAPSVMRDFGMKPLHTQDQLLAAIVRAEDAVKRDLTAQLGHERTLVGSYMQQLREKEAKCIGLESQLAQCKEAAEKWRAYRERKQRAIDAGLAKNAMRKAARKEQA